MENIGMGIICFGVGIGIFYALKTWDFKQEGGSIGYVILLALGSVAWISLFTGGETGVVGYINFVIFGIGMIILHSIIKFFK